MLANAARRAERAGFEGGVDPHWTDRIRHAIGRALSECDRARAAGAVLPVRAAPEGASVEIEGTVSKPLPTEAAHAADWSGLR